MKIFLTGATGLLGSHFLDLGLKRGDTFVIPYRKITRRQYLNDHLENPDIKLIEMDLLNDIDSSHFTEVDVIINCAAFASPFEKDREQMIAINADLPKKLYQLANEKEKKQFVQISSTSVFGSNNSDDVLTEDSTQHMRETPYAKTKKEADEWLDQKSDVLTIHPGFMLDKYDSRPSSGAILMALKMNKFAHYCEQQKNIVAASDVAQGIFQALDKKVNGHYILGGENILISEFLKKACEKIGKNFDDLKQVSKDEINEHQLEREFCLTWPVSSEKAHHDFNYAPNIKTETCLDNTLDWFQEKKLMRIRK